MPMAPGRLYRDYSYEEEDSDYQVSPHFQVPPRRTPSLKQNWEQPATPRTVELDRSSTPQTVVSNGKPDDGRTNGFHDDEIGIARSPDVSDTTFYEDEAAEPVLRESQVELYPIDETDALAPVIPIDIHKTRYLAPSIASISDNSQSTRSHHAAPALKMPEFFSHATFQIVLQNPAIAHQLLKFGQSKLCGENMEFLARVTRYHGLLNEVSKAIYEMHREFIASSGPHQINIPENLLMKVNSEMKSALSSTLPSLESIFVPAQADIERLVFSDVYPKFVRQQMSLSAAKALGTDRTKYAGLGDCFVLTDPAKADNPIVYVSDGFCKVTGYSRNEIVPRNCRFLQSPHTDRAVIRRLKAAIGRREESVELLLNIRKDGEPFWNLLYTTPLFDGHGKLVFFLGGQINCSTTIHNASDVLRILAQSKDTDENAESGAASPQLVKPPRARSILNPFRTMSRSSIQPRAPGMENVLIDKLEDMPLKKQMNTFYTAYSNYIIINYSTFLISFVSGGITDLLFPIKAKTAYHAQAIGTEVFKFLANHGSGSLSWDFKSAVKGGLKVGNPVSLDLKLCARPYMGFERFVTHWTPLKDEKGAVSWVILTLGNEQRA